MHQKSVVIAARYEKWTCFLFIGDSNFCCSVSSNIRIDHKCDWIIFSISEKFASHDYVTVPKFQDEKKPCRVLSIITWRQGGGAYIWVTDGNVVFSARLIITIHCESRATYLLCGRWVTHWGSIWEHLGGFNMWTALLVNRYHVRCSKCTNKPRTIQTNPFAVHKLKPWLLRKAC